MGERKSSGPYELDHPVRQLADGVHALGSGLPDLVTAFYRAVDTMMNRAIKAGVPGLTDRPPRTLANNLRAVLVQYEQRNEGCKALVAA